MTIELGERMNVIAQKMANAHKTKSFKNFKEYEAKPICVGVYGQRKRLFSYFGEVEEKNVRQIELHEKKIEII